MKKIKNGWVTGSVQELLDLSPSDIEFIETRRELSRMFREERKKQNLTQIAIAQRIGSSQSRVAKIEKGDSSVSLDLLFQSLYRLGLNRRKLLKMAR